ncbi:outer membrane beta-barrel protein [uncultured Legionella sp.]|uniref:outer membrane protein n=1 Tax=uncultured Legionella sp. TaxID=210934 RepID=UPI002620329A|nr:outer membrane beta-barrel protein [uncultured Legionella sp.]
MHYINRLKGIINEKKLLTATAALMSIASYAGTMGNIQKSVIHDGWIIGGNIGYGYLASQEEDLLLPVVPTIPSSTEIQTQNHDIGSLIGGGYVGRDFAVLDRLAMGFEVGYKYLGQSKYHTRARNTISDEFIGSDIKVNQQAIDFLLTGKIYIWQSLNLIGKVGPAYVRSQTKQNSSFNLGGVVGGMSTDAAIWRIKPEAGVGLGYTFNNNIGIDLMYTYIGGVDANVTGTNRYFNPGPDRTPAVYQYNALTAGLSYTFG